MTNFNNNWWCPPSWENEKLNDMDVFDLEDFLGHFRAKVDELSGSDGANKEYKEFVATVKGIEERARFLIDDPESAPDMAMTFFILGALAQKIQDAFYFDPDEKQFGGLSRINYLRAKQKDLVQKLATINWGNGSTLRVKEMADATWREMISFLEHRKNGDDPEVDDMIKYGPNDASGLISWVREIAPDFAKRPGRPTKKI